MYSVDTSIGIDYPHISTSKFPLLTLFRSYWGIASRLQSDPTGLENDPEFKHHLAKLSLTATLTICAAVRRATTHGRMDVQELQDHFITLVNWGSDQFVKIPGSAIFLRYVKSSYQDDPIRSAVELFLVLFAIRYLLAPKYSTKPNFVRLSEDVRECRLAQSTGVLTLAAGNR